jgi:hypothetical protein
MYILSSLLSPVIIKFRTCSLFNSNYYLRSEHVFQDGGQHRAGGEALGFQECCVSSQKFIRRKYNLRFLAIF